MEAEAHLNRTLLIHLMHYLSWRTPVYNGNIGVLLMGILAPSGLVFELEGPTASAASAWDAGRARLAYNGSEHPSPAPMREMQAGEGASRDL